MKNTQDIADPCREALRELLQSADYVDDVQLATGEPAWIGSEPRGRARKALATTNPMPALVEALERIAEMAGQTLLGPDSRHRMGDGANRYHEQGAAAAFEQAAEIARRALKLANGEA